MPDTLDPTLVEEGLALKRATNDHQWAWGDWALRVEPMGDGTSNTGAHGRLRTHLSEIHAQAGDATPSFERVLRLRSTAAAWPQGRRNLTAPYLAHVILDSVDERFEVIGRVRAVEDAQREAMLARVKTALTKLRQEHSAEVAKVEEQLATLEEKLDNLADVDLERKAERQAKKEVDQEAARLLTDAGLFEHESLEDLMSKLPSAKAEYQKSTVYTVKEAMRWAAQARMRLSAQGLEPLEANEVQNVADGIDTLRKLAATLDEELSVQKARVF